MYKQTVNMSNKETCLSNCFIKSENDISETTEVTKEVICRLCALFNYKY